MLVMVSIVVKGQNDQGNSYKGKYLIGTGLQFQRFSLLLSCQEVWHDGMQADIVLDKDLRILYLYLKAARRRLEFYTLAEPDHRRPQILLTQWYTSSNKAAPPPIIPHLLIVPLPVAKHTNTWIYMGSKLIQIITFHSLAPITVIIHCKMLLVQLQKSP